VTSRRLIPPPLIERIPTRPSEKGGRTSQRTHVNQNTSKGETVMRYSRLSALLTMLAAAAIAGCLALSSPAEARGHHHQFRQHLRNHHLHANSGHHYRHRHQTVELRGCHRTQCGSFHTSWHGKPRDSHHAIHSPREPGAGSTSPAGASETLATKAQEIVASCHSSVISAFRPGARVAGSGRASLHASGQAVDIRGNPGCIYSYLHGWEGGYSTDYASVQHVHISLGGREDGLRFVHHSSRHASSRHGSHRARGHALDAEGLHSSG
jgi:hypothetical protein